ncbi:MAG: hypothetical protein ABJC13_18110 [Acidobacteriota bacterium]
MLICAGHRDHAPKLNREARAFPVLRLGEAEIDTSEHPEVIAPYGLGLPSIEVLDVKKRAWARFREIPGVHAVGIGCRTVAGTRTDEPAIVVFVSRKKPLHELAGADVVPPLVEGVATDVVEMRPPWLMQGPSIQVNPTALGGPGGGSSFVLSGTDPVATGLIVVVTVTTTPANPAQKIQSFFQSAVTNGSSNLAEIATALARFPSHRPVTATSSGNTLQVVGSAGNTAAVHCYVLTRDSGLYPELRGGIQLGGPKGEVGTLGCLATTGAGDVVALTNEHNVWDPGYFFPHLAVDATLSTITIQEFATPRPGRPHSLVVARFILRNQPETMALYSTTETDTVQTIVAGLITAINQSAASLGVQAKPGSSSPTKATLTLTGPIQPDDVVLCEMYGPVEPDPDARLLVRTVPSPSGITLTFSGTLTRRKRYGIFVRLSRGGSLPSLGTFVDPTGKSLDQIAIDVAAALNVIAPGSASRSGAAVTVLNAQEVECVIEPDTRVGHPTAFFLGDLPFPCSQRIGRVIDARLEIDVALVRLDPGMRYLPRIEGIGAVDGVVPKSLLAPGLAVQKRGAASGITTGRIAATATEGVIFSSRHAGANSLRRYYTNAMVIESTTRDSPTSPVRPFLVGGDSGAAVVTTETGRVRVVGLLFGGDEGTAGLASPIDEIVNAFATTHQLSFDLAPGQDPNAVRTVPAVSGAAPPIPRQALRQPAFGLPEVADMIRRHFAEGRALVADHRRAAAIWRNSGGPEILAALLAPLDRLDRPLPSAIDGRPFADCLARIQRAFLRYASPEFSRDLIRCVPRIACESGLTDSELLEIFRAAPAD